MDLPKYDFLTSLFPFKNLKEKTLDAIFSEIDYKTVSFTKGDTVFSKSSYRKTVAFIVDGICEVERIRSDGDSIPLNSLSKYSSFGILSLFCNGAEYPTEIKAATKATVLFINGQDLIKVIKNYPTVSMNVINFLADRISFLNKKLATFSEKNTVEKLASYLLSKKSACDNQINIAKTKISQELGIGRASLYRGLSYLENNGLIKTETKKIIIICPDGLERILK